MKNYQVYVVNPDSIHGMEDSKKVCDDRNQNELTTLDERERNTGHRAIEKEKNMNVLAIITRGNEETLNTYEKKATVKTFLNVELQEVMRAVDGDPETVIATLFDMDDVDELGLCVESDGSLAVNGESMKHFLMHYSLKNWIERHHYTLDGEPIEDSELRHHIRSIIEEDLMDYEIDEYIDNEQPSYEHDRGSIDASEIIKELDPDAYEEYRQALISERTDDGIETLESEGLLRVSLHTFTRKGGAQ